MGVAASILRRVKALAPGFLIAMPQLVDPNFKRAVVLMMEHSATGSMGLIFNRKAKMSLGDLAKNQELQIARPRAGESIFVGGPVEPYRGFLLHDRDSVGERSQLLPGLFLSVTSAALETLIADPTCRLRFCLGYAGWGPGQVEKEIAQGSWLFTEAVPDTVLRADPLQVWEEVIKSMGVDPAMLVTTGGIN